MVSLVVALYNEQERFPKKFPVIRAFLDSLGKPWELILVNDGSRDATLEMARALAARDSRVRVLGTYKNYGQGSALKIGVLASRGDVVLYMDADLSVEPAFARVLIEKLDTHDVAIASRWMRGAEIGVPQPPLRAFLGRLYYRIIHTLILAGIHDTNCGLKAYRGEAARILYGFVRAWRWAFNVEHLLVAQGLGMRIAEVPTRWSHDDRSKVHVFRDCLLTCWELFCIKLRQWRRLYPTIYRS